MKRGRKIDTSIIGEVFGHLTVLSLCEQRDKHGHTVWNCRCDLCGNTAKIVRQNLISCNTSSCGCRKGTNRQVALAAGVAETVVSAVMRNNWNKRKCSPGVVKRVKEAAQKLGYKPWYNQYH